MQLKLKNVKCYVLFLVMKHDMFTHMTLTPLSEPQDSRPCDRNQASLTEYVVSYLITYTYDISNVHDHLYIITL